MKTVILLRRNPEELTTVEKTILHDRYGADLEFVRTDPPDYRQHLADCQRLSPVAVFLPLDKPIPSAAMDAGFPHITVFPDGSLQRLVDLRAEFEPILQQKE